MNEMTRRDFIKVGAGSAAALALWRMPSLFKTGDDENIRNHFGQFGVDRDIIERSLAEALSQGGDYCDIFFQHRGRNELRLEDGIINYANAKIDFGAGIRVIKGDQTGYSFTEVITPECLVQCARTAARIANSAAVAKAAQLSFDPCRNYYKPRLEWQDIRPDVKIATIQKINDEAFAADKRIQKCSIRYSDEDNIIMVATSTGALRCDRQPLGTLSAFCVAQQGNQREEGFASFSRRLGGEFLKEPGTRELARQAVGNTVKLFGAAKPRGGEMEVVLGAGDMGILLHEAIGHGMEADFNRKGESVFCDKIGKRVADKTVSIFDDGTVQNWRGSINIDDEAGDSAKTLLVNEGILQGYMHDHISCCHYGAAATGSGRRESFRFAPMPRMRNTYMLNGPFSPAEIIESVKNGLYVEQVSNGQVMIGAGDFTFYVVSGQLIENGKLTGVVKDVNIIGNGPEALRNICMVGNDFKMAARSATCGKNGQWVPVSFGMPTAKIAKLTVGS